MVLCLLAVCCRSFELPSVYSSRRRTVPAMAQSAWHLGHFGCQFSSQWLGPRCTFLCTEYSVQIIPYSVFILPELIYWSLLIVIDITIYVVLLYFYNLTCIYWDMWPCHNGQVIYICFVHFAGSNLVLDWVSLIISIQTKDENAHWCITFPGRNEDLMMSCNFSFQWHLTSVALGVSITNV